MIRLLALLLATTAHAQSPRVIDGDTVSIAGERFRLATHDAPELYAPRCAREEVLALFAKWRLHDLTRPPTWSITHVPCWSGRWRDPYGRQCVVLRVFYDDAMVDVGDILIRESLAVPFGHGRPDWCNLGEAK